MPAVSVETIDINCSVEDAFDLVADIEKYIETSPNFSELCDEPW